MLHVAICLKFRQRMHVHVHGPRILLSVRTISVEPSCCPAATEVLASNKHTLVSSTSSTNWEEGKEISIQEKRDKFQTATIHLHVHLEIGKGNCTTLYLTHVNK